MYNAPYQRPYTSVYNQQNMYEQIDNQIHQLQQMRDQMKNNTMQPAINQTFQLAPTGTNTLRYANTIDDVSKEMIFGDTPFFSKDMTVLWIKNTKGNIKTYELSEIIPRDDKDMQIEYLQAQIEELKGMITNEQPITNATTKQNATDTTEDDESAGTTVKKSKSTGFSKVSTSKEK